MTWKHIAYATTEDGDQILLRRRGEEFDIRFNGWELMASRSSATEAALAGIVCKGIANPEPTVLIGGLGMGYTLRATLDLVGESASVFVCELLSEVVTWNHGPLAVLARCPLKDPRVTVWTGSVADVLAKGRHRFDAIMMDTDNGPDYVVHEPNRFLYSVEGLRRLKELLQPNGVAGFWSADRSPEFESRLASLDWNWRQVQVPVAASNNRVAHTVYLLENLR